MALPPPPPSTPAGAPEPVTPLRVFLLQGVRRFVERAAALPGLGGIALIGSLTTAKATPKDADVLVRVVPTLALDALAKAARSLKGHGQTRNSGADVFLADLQGRYIGRVCHWRECQAGIRMACRAEHCARRTFLCDDLQVVRLSDALVAAPPIELWPEVVRRVPVPADVQEHLLQPLLGAAASQALKSPAPD